jgi:hypothetical protein
MKIRVLHNRTDSTAVGEGGVEAMAAPAPDIASAGSFAFLFFIFLIPRRKRENKRDNSNPYQKRKGTSAISYGRK